MQQFEQFGKYILLEKLAAGGMAEVYLAKSLGANGVSKFLAIKRILPQFSENDEFIEMFKEEAKIAVNLNHGNVVSIFDFGVERSQFFLVMEYVEGRNLRQIINEIKKNSYKFSIEQVVYMIKEVAAGLDHAHRCIDGSTGRPLNITHRDMSPQNIMVSFEGEVKIIDFGIAKAETQLEATKAGTLKGKFGYMSPEQADGLPIDLRTDIFSLGIVLWEILANDRLFTASSEAAILRKIRDCQVPSVRKVNPAIPPELERIVNKALTKDKGLRYQTAAAMHRDLNRFLNTQYPEFTPNDFSVFIKNTFAASFQEQKRKLVEYSQVQAGTENSDSSSNRTIVANDDDDSFGPQLSINTGLHQKVELKDLNNSIDRKTMAQSKQNTAGMVMTNGGSASNPKPPPKLRSHTKTGYKQPTGSGLLMPFILVVLIGGAGFIFLQKSQNLNSADGWKQKLNALMATVLGKEIPTTHVDKSKDTTQPNIIETSSTAEYFVSVRSNPSRARILIDNEDTGSVTPAQIKVPADKQVIIKLIKDDGEGGLVYIPYDKPFKATKNAETIDATLQSQLAGYLNIEISYGGGDTPFIEVNGVRLKEKPPIERYAVPANTPVKIRGVNPFTKAFDEQTVTVRPDERKPIKLVFKFHTGKESTNLEEIQK